jgi:hypothetical protein
MLRNCVIVFLFLVTPFALAQEREIDGEILKISKKRTVVLIDLAGDEELSEGDAFSMDVRGKARTGTVESILNNGKAMIKLNKGLPKAVAVGASVKLALTGEKPATAKKKQVRLTKGFYNKAYWDDVSYLASHRRSGTRTDLEVGTLSKQGARDSSGGTQQDDTEFAYSEKSTSANGSAGWVGRGGIGGGVSFDYLAADREISANIDTASSGTTDKVADKLERKVTNFTPYFAFLSRVKTGDIGFGAGLGYLVRSMTADYKMQDGVDISDPKEAKVTQAGPTLEGLIGANTWSTILQINPGIKGKEKQTGFDDVERTSSEFGLHYEYYGQRLKKRIGLVYYSDKGESDQISQKDTGYKFSMRFDLDFRKFHLVPFLDVTNLRRKLDAPDASAEGTQRTTDIGTRVAWSGVLAPFVSMGVSILNEKQSGKDIPSTKTAAGGFRIAGGISI